MMKHRLKRAISLLCAFAICVGLLPAGALAVQGLETPTGGINGYQATMQADAITSTGWQDAFVVASGGTEIDGKQRSSALNGKIWADKSVALAEDDETFDVTFSTLGQTFASSTTTTSSYAYDVAFVLDFSGSMNDSMSGGTTRAEAMVDALNVAMTSLMQNENNRVGIIRYSGSSASELLPLDHYTTTETSGSGNTAVGQYFDYDGRTVQSGRYSTDYYYIFTNGQRVFINDGNASWSGTSTVKNSNNQTVTVNYRVNDGTPTQRGIYAAQSMLNAQNNGAADGDITRIPLVVLLTDGAPGSATSAYDDLQDGTSYEGEANLLIGVKPQNEKSDI